MVNLYLVLIEPEYGGNLGLIARVAKNFDIEGIVILNPKFDLDESRQRAMHAQDIINNIQIVKGWEEIRKKFTYLVAASAKIANQYNVNRASFFPWEIKKVKNMALVIGRESSGLTNEEVMQCDALVRIPTSEKYRSMSISHAVTVLLYEMYKREEEREMSPFKLREQIYKSWGELLGKLGYPQDKRRIQTLLFKRVIERAIPFEREAYGIAGVISKTLKKLKQKD